MTGSPYISIRRSGQARLLRAMPRLEQLDIELTERCNNDCVHCCINLPEFDEEAKAREMPTWWIEGILRQAADLGCLEVRFTGGEPLLRPDFEDLYLFTRRLGMKVLLYTNACLITPGMADLFARIPPLLPIEITVYGMRKKSYEAVTRAPGSFVRFQLGASLLLKRKVPFVVKSVILPANRDEMDEFESWAKGIPAMSKPPSYALFLDLRNRRDSANRNALIQSLRMRPLDAVAMLTRDPEKYRCGVSEFSSKYMGASGDTLFGCGAGHCICIDAYGRAQPCMGIRAPELTIDMNLGHPPDGGKASVSALENSMLAGVLDHFAQIGELRANNPEYLRRCAKCFLRGLCEQCPAKSWAEHGNLDTPVEYLCDVAHAQARYLGWLGEKEHGWEAVDVRGGGARTREREQ